MNNWISVKNETPKDDKVVFVKYNIGKKSYDKNGVAFLFDGEWHLKYSLGFDRINIIEIMIKKNIEITHWMEIPRLEEEKNE